MHAVGQDRPHRDALGTVADPEAVGADRLLSGYPAEPLARVVEEGGRLRAVSGQLETV